MPDRPLKRILILDDDPDLLGVTMLALSSLGGYAVEACTSPMEALERVRSFAPDLVLLDVMMPGMDGFTTLEALRRIETTAETPVVFVTALVEPRDLALYDELGVVGVVPKPFDPATLPDTLEEFWKDHLLGRPSGARLAQVERAC